MNHQQSVSIIILNWNGKNDTLRCLESINRLIKRDYDVDVYIVDNGSTDDSVKAIQHAYKTIHVIQSKENKGFAEGNNIGMRYAMEHGAQYIWLLNNDTIVEKNSLIELLSAFNDSSVGIASSKIYFMKGHEFHHDRYKSHEKGKVIWYAGGIIDWNNVYGFHNGVDEVDVGQYDQECETEYATGCSMMIRKACIDSIGMFDERYFAYLEDMEFCIRAKQSNWKIMYVPKSVVWHKNAGSTARPGNDFHQYYFTRNRLLFGFEYCSWKTRFALARESVRFFLFGTTNQRKAVLDAMFQRFGKQYLWQQ